MNQLILNSVLTAVQGHQIIYDESDEKDNISNSKTMDFAEETVPRFRDNQFKQHFRMFPVTFENLLEKLHKVTPTKVDVGHPEIPIEKQLMVTLWCLANIESFRCVSDRFGISKSTCWEVLCRTCERLLQANRMYNIISWPTRRRTISITEEFKVIIGFEGVIGCIDGSHIRIVAPKEHPNSYCNRKNYHSILLQGVCDAKKLFTHVYAGEPGSIHDNRLFEKSDLYEGIRNGQMEFFNGSFLLGDLAYKLAPYLIVGFKDNGHLTNSQRRFNILLAQVRVVIENAFGLLKGRFRRRKYMETRRLFLISLLTVSACILHNICILNGDLADDIIDIHQEVEEERRLNEIQDNFAVRQVMNQMAVLKRREIMNQLGIP